MRPKGWYIIPGVQDGDRTLKEQLTGLGTIEREAKGRSILDLGCAEGLIAKHLVELRGASSALGLSLVASEIEAGRAQCAGLPVSLNACDLNDFAAWRAVNPDKLQQGQYDLVLLLSILHKLKEPLQFLEIALEYACDLVAVRLPGPVIRDARSFGRAFDVRPVLKEGFDLLEKPLGPRGEWQSIWRRK